MKERQLRNRKLVLHSHKLGLRSHKLVLHSMTIRRTS